MNFDVVVIGSGPAGFSAAKKLAGRKRVLLVERSKSSLGGVCLNRGCISAKTLFHIARSIEKSKSSGKVKIDFAKIKKIARENVLFLRNALYENLKSRGVEFEFGRAEFVDEKTIRVSKKKITADYFVVATGSAGIVPENVKGKLVVSIEKFLENPFIKSKITVLGGGWAGCEIAGILNCFGVKVSLIEKEDRLLPSEDKDISTAVEKKLKGKGVKIVKGTEKIKGDVVIFATGRKPFLSFLPEKAGIRICDGFVKVRRDLSTSRKNIFACGDIVKTMPFANTAMREGEKVALRILGENVKLNYDAVPKVVFTNPPVAMCGIDEEQAKKSGISFEVEKIYLKSTAAYKILGEDGFAKIIFDKNKKILGAALMLPSAEEIIHLFAYGILNGMTIDDLRETFYFHPTACEIFASFKGL